MFKKYIEYVTGLVFPIVLIAIFTAIGFIAAAPLLLCGLVFHGYWWIGLIATFLGTVPLTAFIVDRAYDRLLAWNESRLIKESKKAKSAL